VFCARHNVYYGALKSDWFVVPVTEISGLAHHIALKTISCTLILKYNSTHSEFTLRDFSIILINVVKISFCADQHLPQYYCSTLWTVTVISRYEILTPSYKTFLEQLTDFQLFSNVPALTEPMFLSRVDTIFPLYIILTPVFTPITLRFVSVLISHPRIVNNTRVKVPYREANGRLALVKVNCWVYTRFHWLLYIVTWIQSTSSCHLSALFFLLLTRFGH
jgi:hypothetical protein